MLAVVRAQRCPHIRSILARSRRIPFQRVSARNVATSTLHPCIQGFASSLTQTQPCFSVSSDKIRLLFEPHDFYNTLLDMIHRAQRRIFISSLYIGSSENELIDSLRNALASNPHLEVHIQLDLNRSTRPGPSSAARILSPLLTDFPERVHISLFRSPKLKGLMARLVPPRFNEGWGTWHAKIYGADDEVMISGANLSQSYFTNRQDRYIHFSASDMAEYCMSFVSATSSFSYRLLPPSGSSDAPTLHWPHPTVHPHHIERTAGSVLNQLQESYRSKSDRTTSNATGRDEVLVFPVIQGGQFGIREEEHCLRLLFEELSKYYVSVQPPRDAGPLIDLTSGYFGLYKPYQELVLRSPASTRIICASPRANGFYGSRGISGRIPEAYTLLEQRFMRAVKAAGRADEVMLREWQKGGWTYHSKGIWLSPSPTEPPVMTLFGSTNLNSRSSHLDTELSFVMATSSMALREKLGEEVRRLNKFAVPWQGAQRPVRTGTKGLVSLVGGML